MADPAPAAAGCPYEGPQQLREPLAAALSRGIGRYMAVCLLGGYAWLGIVAGAAAAWRIQHGAEGARKAR